MIKMHCPHCGHSLSIAEEYAGKRGKCRYCSETFIVGQPTAAAPAHDNEAVRREGPRREQTSPKQHDTQRQLATEHAFEAARIREREDRRSRRLLFGVVFLITGVIVGGFYWFMDTTGKDIRGVFLPADKAAEVAEIPVESVELLGVSIPTFGNPPTALDVSIEWAAAFEGIEKEKVSCYQIPVPGGYDDVVLKVQLALTRLGWDYTIWMGDEPYRHTELHGRVEGRQTAMRIEEVEGDVLVYAGVIPE